MPLIHNLLAGRYTDPAGNDGICCIKLAGEKLAMTDVVSAGANPSYFVVGSGLLYAANEVDTECRIGIYTVSKEGIKVFNRDGEKGKVMLGPGSGACHLSFDNNSGLLFASCYGSGHIHCFNTRTLSLSCSYLPKDPHNSHAHNTSISSDGKWLFSADLGKDKIYIFAMEDVIDKRMVPAASYRLSPGTGPRQVITGLSDDRIICVNELSSTMTLLHFDEKAVRLYPEHTTASTMHTEPDIKNYPGSAVLAKNGKHLIVPNRGVNTLALFEIDNNELIYKYECDCHGDWPRFITFTGEGRYLLAANQKSGNVALFAYHEEDGKHMHFLHSIAVRDVSCIIAL